MATKKATKDLKKGDKVKWDSRNGEVEGTVEGKVTKTTKVKGHTAKATKDEPQVKVKSDKTGAVAIHKPEELKKSTAKSTAPKSSTSKSSTKSKK